MTEPRSVVPPETAGKEKRVFERSEARPDPLLELVSGLAPIQDGGEHPEPSETDAVPFDERLRTFRRRLRARRRRLAIGNRGEIFRSRFAGAVFMGLAIPCLVGGYLLLRGGLLFALLAIGVVLPVALWFSNRWKVSATRADGLEQPSAETVLQWCQELGVPFALYLRGFEAERRLPKPRQDQAKPWLFWRDSRQFERRLIRELQIPVVALRDPDQPDLLHGAFRFRDVSSHERWVDVVALLSHRAQFVAVWIDYFTSGIRTELEILARERASGRVLLALSPRAARDWHDKNRLLMKALTGARQGRATTWWLRALIAPLAPAFLVDPLLQVGRQLQTICLVYGFVTHASAMAMFSTAVGGEQGNHTRWLAPLITAWVAAYAARFHRGLLRVMDSLFALAVIQGIALSIIFVLFAIRDDDWSHGWILVASSLIVAIYGLASLAIFLGARRSSDL